VVGREHRCFGPRPPAGNDSIASTLGWTDKPWYGGTFSPQRVAPYGAQKVAKSKRDVDGGRQGRGRRHFPMPMQNKNQGYCRALAFVVRFKGVAALSIVDPTTGESDGARAHIPSGRVQSDGNVLWGSAGSEGWARALATTESTGDHRPGCDAKVGSESCVTVLIRRRVNP